MTENVSIQNLFQVGFTKEQFLDKYAELKEQANPDFSSSVFGENMSAAAISAMFDVIDTDHNNKLDENDLKKLKDYNKADGEDTLSESDITVLYEKTINSLTDKYKTDNPQQMYDNAVTNGDLSQYDYTQMISGQIAIINELIDARKLDSRNKINNYQMQIDNLILRSTKVSTETKVKYDNITNSIKQTEKLADSAKKKAEEIHEEMLNTEAEIKHLKEKNDDKDKNRITDTQTEYQNLSNEYTKYTNKYSTYSNQLSTLKKSLSELQKKAISEDADLKSRIETIEKKIATEKQESENDIANYNTRLDQLTAAQEYAMTQQSEETFGDNYSDEDTSNFSYDAAELKKKWAVKGEPQFSDGFYNKVVEISKRVGCDPNALMAVMKSESGLKTTAKNPHGGATGLIQFMPATAKALGTTTDALSKMSPEQQLVYVEKFLMQNKRMAGFKEGDKLDSGTLYTLVFLPAYAKRDVLCTKGTKYYKYNAGLDLNHDGSITKQDMTRRVHQFMK